jgi:hypothetical protein
MHEKYHVSNCSISCWWYVYTCLDSVAGNSFAGIGIKGMAKPLLDSLTIRENQGYGVLLQDTASTVMQNCIVEDNKKSGLCCTGHSVLRLSMCNVG